MLLVKKLPHMPLKKVIEKYWYEDAFGRHFYSLEHFSSGISCPSDRIFCMMRVPGRILSFNKSGLFLCAYERTKLMFS